ncbi:MAG TPA: protein translocase subunit SecD, partial [Usitatibacter sp.]
MNKYPTWKYILIAVAILVSVVYAVPNLFGEVPAVQVSPQRATVKIDNELRASLEEALKAAKFAPVSVEQSDATLRFLFADTDTQAKAIDVIKAKAGSGFVVALNLVPNSPHWLQALGSKPMYLGLDLRGGVHFLLQVDMKAAADKSVNRYLGDTRGLLREKKIYYSALAREGDRIVARFKEPEQRAAALKAMSDAMPDLTIREQDSGGDSALVASIKPEVVKREQDLALQQNIQTLRNRVNELGVAEPIVQQQGNDR